MRKGRFQNPETMTKEQKLQAALMKAAHRLKKDRMEFLFKEISQREFMMLERIVGHESEPNKGIFVSELAQILQVSTPAVSRMLKSLEDQTFVRREIDPNDRRNTMIFVTEHGMEVLERQEDLLDEMMGNVVRKMGFEKMEELIRLWTSLADHIEEEIEERKHV